MAMASLKIWPLNFALYDRCLLVRCSASRKRNRGIAVPIIDLGVRRGWVVTGTSRPLYPRDTVTVPIAKEAAWVPGPGWTGADNLAPTGIRTPYSAAWRESLC